jgi:hypothetical protein
LRKTGLILPDPRDIVRPGIFRCSARNGVADLLFRACIRYAEQIVGGITRSVEQLHPALVSEDVVEFVAALTV